MRLVLNFLFPVIVSVFFLFSCDEDDPVYSPKPRGYPRVIFPEKQYRMFDTACAYKFEVPVYTRITADLHKNAEPCWYNIEYPTFKATVHLSYKNVNNDISKYINDSHNFANKHQVKATGLDETVVLRDSARVYGLLFDIAGNTASSVQFYLTDSTRHFLRGSLYFNCVPNIDSMKIVVDFIREDILHLINTAQWKNEIQEKKKS